MRRLKSGLLHGIDELNVSSLNTKIEDEEPHLQIVWPDRSELTWHRTETTTVIR